MKIDVKTLEKLVWIIYKRFFIEKGKLKDIQIKIDQYIQIRMVLVYKGIETKIHIDARPYVNEDIIIWISFRDRKSTRLNSSHLARSRMPSSA